MDGRDRPSIPHVEAEVEPSRDVVTITAVPENVREIIREFSSYIDIVPVRVQEKSIAKAVIDEEYGRGMERQIYSTIALSHRLACIACGDVRLYLPSLFMEERIRNDGTIMSIAVSTFIREAIYPKLRKIRELVEKFMMEEETEKEKTREEIISSFIQLIKALKQTIIAQVIALLNVLSARSLNLPAELRSSLINMQVLGADISYSSVYRIMREVQEEERRKEEKRLISLASKYKTAGSGGAGEEG